MHSLLNIIQSDVDFMETENILKYMFFINTTPHNIEAPEKAIDSILKEIYKHFNSLFSNKYWGSDFRIENLLSDEQVRMSLFNHLIISTLYSVKQNIWSSFKIKPYSISDRLEGSGFFELFEHAETIEKYRNKKYILNSRCFNSLKTESDFRLISPQNFSKKLNTLRESPSYTSRIFNSLCLDNKLDLCSADFIYNLCLSHNSPKTKNSLIPENYFNFINNCKDNISKIEPKSANEAIDKLLLCYEFERYYSADLLDHIMKCRHVLFTSSNPVYKLGNLGNFDRIMRSAILLPNAFSRKTYVNFAFSGLLSTSISNNQFIMSDYKKIIDSFGTLTPPRLPHMEHENIWISLLEKFFLHLSYFVFPVMEKAFYITLYNYCKSTDQNTSCTFLNDNLHETERKMFNLLYSYILVEDNGNSLHKGNAMADSTNSIKTKSVGNLKDTSKDAKKETSKIYIKNFYDDFSPTKISIIDAMSNPQKDEASKSISLTSFKRFKYLKYIYEKSDSIKVPPKQVKQFWNTYYKEILSQNNINDYFDRTFSIDYFTRKPNEKDSERFKADIVSKYYNNVVDNSRM